MNISAVKNTERAQKIIVFQQDNSGESKIQGIRQYGGNHFDLKIISLDVSLPPVVDDAPVYLPKDIDADLVLDFLKHPDLSYSLALMCRERKIPVVASGKKIKVEGVFTPPT